MKPSTKQLILLQEDYQLLKNHTRSVAENDSIESKSARKLAAELENNPLVLEKDAFPKDVIRIHSEVILQDLKTKKEVSFTLVLPGEANVQLKKVSIYAPMGTAVIGYKQGDEFRWEMPSGERAYTILRVTNPE